MKAIILNIFLLIGLSIYAQNKSGNLLLLKIDKYRDLKIEKEVHSYLVIELGSNYQLKFENSLTRPVFFQDFTDGNIFSCIERDSIKLKTLFKDDTFENVTEYGFKNYISVEKNSIKMNPLMELNIKSPLYNQKIKISYTLISADYCIGSLAKYDSEVLGFQGEILLITNALTIKNEYKLPKEKIFDIIKCIDFNNYIY